MTAEKPEPDPSPRHRLLLELAQRLGHEFSDIDLLDRALCHASTANSGKENYERLEFLGDAILGFLVADNLYNLEPEIPEGELTDRRANMVSRTPLAAIAKALDLPAYLETGRGLKTSDLESPRIHADLVEAVTAAIYLDGGIRPVRKFVARHVIKRLGDSPESRAPRNPKSRLLHYAQINELGQPTYKVTDIQGPDHQRVFTVVVVLDKEEYSSGTASSKQAAEMRAAEATLGSLETQRLPDEADAEGDSG